MRSFLICRTDRIGDLVLSLPVALSLKRFDRSSRVGYLVNPYTAPLLDHHPDVDFRLVVRVRGGDRGGILGPSHFIKSLSLIKEMGVQTALALHSKPSIAYLLFVARVKERVGPSGRYYSILYTHKVDLRRRGIHVSRRNLLFLESLGIPLVDESPRLYLTPQEEEDGERHWMGREQPRVLLHLSSRTASTWPEEYFGELASLLISEGIKVAVTGKNSIAPRDGLINYREDLPLRSLMGLIWASDAVVVGSTGILHLSAALGKKTFALIDPSLPYHSEEWRPMGRGHKVYVPQESLYEIKPRDLKRDILQSLKDWGGSWRPVMPED